MPQPQIFAGSFLRTWRHGWREAFIEQFKLDRPHLNFPGSHFRIGHAFRSWRDLACNLDNVFSPQRLARFDYRWRAVRRIEDNLSESVPVAEIDKQPAAVIAVAIDPSTQGDRFAKISFVQLTARMCSEHVIPRQVRLHLSHIAPWETKQRDQRETAYCSWMLRSRLGLLAQPAAESPHAVFAGYRGTVAEVVNRSR